jgi:1,2-diacylglycerol 3-alpha-glucosyltransferase
VRMYAEVRKRMPEAMLVIAGEGPAQGALRKQVDELGLQEDVKFVGYLDRDTSLLDCYAAADVFVFASRTETQGLVLLEAMAQGAPLVSTAELGAKSILTPGCGALVVRENLDEFSGAVIRVLRDAHLRQGLSQEAREHAGKWSSLSMANRLAELYASVAESFHPADHGARPTITPPPLRS